MSRSLITFQLVAMLLSTSVRAFGVSTKRATRTLSSSSRLFTGPSDNDDVSSATTLILNGPIIPEQSPNAKRLFLVRHGEVINPGGDRPVYYGAMDVPLSPLGEQEAQMAAIYLQQFELSHVFASPLKRAIYGAERVAEQQHEHQKTDPPVKVTILDGFKEMERGSWCGKTKEEIGEDAMEKFNLCEEDSTPEGAESYGELRERVTEALEEVLKQMEPGQKAAIVSHLQVTRCLVADAQHMLNKEIHSTPISTASVTCIDYEFWPFHSFKTVHFQSYKPEAGLEEAKDGAN